MELATQLTTFIALMFDISHCKLGKFKFDTRSPEEF